MNIENNNYLNEWNKIYFEMLKDNNNDNNNIEIYKKVINFLIKIKMKWNIIKKMKFYF